MTGFLVFIFSHYYPSGGWKDFKANYPTLVDAIKYAEEKLIDEGKYTIAQIVDTETLEIIWSSKG